MSKKTPKLLGREAILSDLKTVAIDVPEWGGHVRIREMGLRQRLEFGDFATEGASGGDVAGYLLAVSLIDERGERLFTDEEIDLLSSRNQDAVNRVCNEILKLNRLDGQAEKN